MKKRRLKKWVKVTLLIIGMVLFTGLLYLSSVSAEKEITECVKEGYTRNYCIKKLS